jgi:cytochrome c553
MMKIKYLLFAVTALSTPLYAADAENGKLLSKKCSVCHGQLGLARDPEVPHLAGQSALYIEKALMDFQKGDREDRRMTLMVKGLSKEEIKDIAAWYSSLKISVEDPNS